MLILPNKQQKAQGKRAVVDEGGVALGAPDPRVGSSESDMQWDDGCVCTEGEWVTFRGVRRALWRMSGLHGTA